MNHNDENKAPITRVFNLNGLRKSSTRSGSIGASTAAGAGDYNRTSNSKIKFDFEADLIQNSAVPVQKKVYNVSDLSSLYKERELEREKENTIKRSQKIKSENENVELVATPISVKTPEKVATATAFVPPTKTEPDELIAQHVSEIDIDDNYGLKKVNPFYKSDSEDDDERRHEKTKRTSIKRPVAHEIDFDDYNDVYQEPTQVHTAFEKMTNPNVSVVQVATPADQNGDEIYATINENDLYLTPVELKLDSQESPKKKESDKEIYIKDLKSDMVRENVSVRVSCSVVRENIAIVCVYERLWVAGLYSKNVSRSLYRHLYIGDIIIAINNDTVNNIYELNSSLEKYKGTSLQLKIRRLPYARAVFVPLPLNVINTLDSKYARHAKALLGLKLESGKARIEKIEENSIVYRHGLRFNPNRFVYDIAVNEKVKVDDDVLTDEKNRLTTWMFTEINGNPINLFSDSDAVAKLLFTTNDNDICFIVQPTDLIKILLKELKKKYQNWKNYIIA